MNTKLISSATVLSLPCFPELSAQKSNRVVTKHFTNAALYLLPNQIALLNWLIYQSKVDNTVVYSTQLLIRFCATVKEVSKTYNNDKLCFSTDIKYCRQLFKTLIQDGYLLPNYKKNVFTINPMLTYRAEYMRPKDYKSICDHYTILMILPEGKTSSLKHSDICIFCRRYSEIVEGYMKKKKLAK